MKPGVIVGKEELAIPKPGVRSEAGQHLFDV
jgi:hypothetical protein